MATLELSNVTLEYPLFKSIKRGVLASLGQSRFLGGQLQRTSEKSAKVVALSNINLKLGDGDRVAVFGHNSSGKTTLLKTLSGFYKPQQGHVHTVGRIASVLNMVSGLRMSMSAEDNIDLSLVLAGVPQNERLERKTQILVNSQLGEFACLPIEKLSSGMLMRLAFSISTISDPDILLLDEWVGVGDLRFIDKAKVRLEELVERSGLLVYATHNPTIANKLCNQAICLHRGEIVMRGTVNEVSDYYRQSMESGPTEN